MREEKAKENLLSSWKEIAGFLDCHVRTCIRWEKQFGLPVHRMDASQKSRVFAYKDEIEKWQKECFKSENGFIKFYRKQRSFYKNPHFIYPAAIILTAVLILAFIFFPKGTQQPDDFRIEKSRLIILDDEGKKMWEFDSGIENLEDEKFYRDHFQVKNRIENKREVLPLLIIKDINKDGKNEILFAPVNQDRFGIGHIICLDHKGKNLWSYESGRSINSYSEEFSNDFSLYGIDTLDFDGDKDKEILLIADHRFYEPTQFIILDSNGSILGEYWNSGRLVDYATIDLNLNGKKELIIAGMNNEYNKGMIVVFDPENISGCSPQIEDKFRFKYIGSGTEKYYILFPRTDVDLELHLREVISFIDILDNKRISVMAKNSQLFFEFDIDLQILSVRPSDTFRKAHIALQEQGKINSILDDEYLEQLKNGILYHNGENWVSEPVKRNPWKKSDH